MALLHTDIHTCIVSAYLSLSELILYKSIVCDEEKKR